MFPITRAERTADIIMIAAERSGRDLNQYNLRE